MVNPRINPRTWALLLASCVGGIIIIAGNALTSVSQVPELRASGTGLRQLGLIVCVLTGLAFLACQYQERIRRFATKRLSHRTDAAVGDEVPSPLLIALIRVYCLLLILFGTLASTFWVWQSSWFGPTRFLFVAAQSALFLVPGFLIWSMTNVIVRIGTKLEDVSTSIRALQDRADKIDGRI